MSETEKKEAGRPSDYSEEIADRICEEIASGESLVDICKAEDMPHRATVFRWLAKEEHKVFRDMYALAREAQAECLADELISIADDGSNDWMQKNHGENVSWAVNGEHINRSRLRVDTRKWIAAKLKPRKYGDSIHQKISAPDGGPVETKNVDNSAHNLALKMFGLVKEGQKEAARNE